MNPLILTAILGATNPNAAVTRESYEARIDQAQILFGPYVEKLGYTLKIFKNWESPLMSCYTTAERLPEFRIVLNGEAFRNAETTNDGMAYTVCHEIAHIIGGPPKYTNDDFWGSAEGQADYVASNLCLKVLFQQDDNIALLDLINPPEIVRTKCDAAFSNPNDSALCQRSIMAGHSFASNNRRNRLAWFTGSHQSPAYRSLATPLSLTRRDPQQVAALNRSYAVPQCRLDTAMAGALCERGGNFDPAQAQDPQLFNCGLQDSLETRRPRCWFK